MENKIVVRRLIAVVRDALVGATMSLLAQQIKACIQLFKFLLTYDQTIVNYLKRQQFLEECYR